MHPVLKDGVAIGTFQYEGSDVTHYYVENAEGDEFEISCNLWNALLRADGTHPLELPDKGRRILPKLKEYGLVHTSRFVQENSFINRFILFPFRGIGEKGKKACKTINSFLLVTTILIFIAGICFMILKNPPIGYDVDLWIYYSMLIVSLILHEAGHLVAGLSYDYSITDVGVLLFGVIPVGAYVAYDEDQNDVSKAKKVHFSLAGIEMNLMIAGMCLLIPVLYYPLSLTFILIANINLAIAAINLLPVYGLDGEAALNAACGIKSISKMATKWLIDKKRRRRLLSRGLPGYVCCFVFSLILLAKAFFWLVICIEISAIFYNFL